MFERSDIINLRHLLHSTPELSGKEFNTVRIIKDFFSELNPDKVIELRTGVAFVFNGKQAGPVFAFRADIDGVAVKEDSELPYRSKNENVSHACGHDGHSVILCKLGSMISKNRPVKGKVILIFQHAEETGEGAKQVLEDPYFQNLNISNIFGMHNIPGFSERSILVKDNCFACASKGMTINFYGSTSHASEPEKGRSPVPAIIKIISDLQSVLEKTDKFSINTSLTVVHISAGERSFGVNPGYGEISLTLRSDSNDDIRSLTELSELTVKKICEQKQLKYDIKYSEVFPALMNDSKSVDIVRNAAVMTCLDISELNEPFRWSEDFARYTQKYKGAFFGIGSGIEHPPLHNCDYDFPDSIIQKAVEIFYNIYEQILSQ